MKKFLSILFIGMILVVTGCADYLSVNNPNTPEDASIDLILPGAQTSLMVTFGGDYATLAGFWAQYYTQAPDAGQYEDYDEYNIPSDKFDNQWQEFYAGGMNDLEVIRQKATESGDNAYYLVATLLQCYGYQVMADLYGRIPFSEALNGAADVQILNPKFEDGSVIYPALIDRIDEAVDRYTNGLPGLNPGASDLIYGGDMTEWVRFANTLKLKMYMRQVYTGNSVSSEISSLLSENNFITKDAMIDDFVAEQHKRNPYYEIQVDRLGDVNVRASLSLLQVLVDWGDPRIDEIYTAGSNGHNAKIQGDFANRDIPNGQLSKPKIGATDPVYFMLVCEKDFLVAEALVRFAGGAGAQAAYEAGIEGSFAVHGLTGASAFYGSGGAYEYNATGNVEADIAQIMTQKWIAMANLNNLEAFFDINRTQYPAYQSVSEVGNLSAIGELTYSFGSVLPPGMAPRRLLVPDREIQRNTNAPSNSNQDMGLKVWWDEK